MKNNNRFYVKFLGVFMIEITNVTPEKIGKLFTKIAIFIIFIVLLLKLPEYMQAYNTLKGQ